MEHKIKDEKVSISASPNRSTTSPPPNCAICLGTCTNKCVLDSCMHQFCFNCVLKWSKIKAECPLCKQPFKSIIHNIKSNNEYDEHIIGTSENTESSYNSDNFLYVPSRSMRQMMRHFEVRTTLTVDLRGELEISYLTHSPNSHRRYRRDVSSTAFRKSIYNLNLWSNAPPDITGRYRVTNPEFYRLNPHAINRLAPWLNRELNALLDENTQQVMTLVDVILTHLREHHIKGRFFRNLLSQYFGNNTTHFIHEFYNFMQSPFDMIGYDRHVLYTHRHVEIVSDFDVQVIDNDSSVTSPNALQTESNEIIEIRSDSDSDVIIISDTENQNVINLDETNNLDESIVIDEPINLDETPPLEEAENRKPILPLKIRLKRKRQSREGHWKSKRKHRHSSSSSDTSDESNSSSKSNYSSRKHRRKHKSKKHKNHDHKSSSRSHVAESSDDEPLSYLQRKLKRDAGTSNHTSTGSKMRHKEKRKKSKQELPEIIDTKIYKVETEANIDTEKPKCQNANTVYDMFADTENFQEQIKDETVDNKTKNMNAGPSGTSNGANKKEINNWYYRPQYYSDSDDESE